MAVHPCVHAYLERLPAGLASYPECLAKASILRDMLATRPLAADDVPPELTELVLHPPPVSSWIPEVWFCTAASAIYGRHFGGRDLDGYVQWIEGFNEVLFRKPLYRVLFALISPSRLVAGAANRWAAFHRGITFELVERTPLSVLVRLDFPPYIYGIEMLHALSAGLRAAIRVAGGHDPSTEIALTTATRAEYWVRWSD